MKCKCNFHTHSTYCDGKNSPEELVLEAIERGFDALGFSSHFYSEAEKDFAMSREAAPRYKAEISRLREKYADKIQIFCGIEKDFFSNEPSDGYDYVIGSVHYVVKSGEYICVDASAGEIKAAVDRLYGGDFDALSEDYFALVADVVRKTGADIIGHFDLVSKFSEQNGYTQSERFLAAARKAVAALIPCGKPFEINTGGMARKVRSVPYPSPEILSVIKELGGKILFSSDCHKKELLDYGFEEAASIAKSCGFTDDDIVCFPFKKAKF